MHYAEKDVFTINQTRNSSTLHSGKTDQNILHEVQGDAVAVQLVQPGIVEIYAVQADAEQASNLLLTEAEFVEPVFQKPVFSKPLFSKQRFPQWASRPLESRKRGVAKRPVTAKTLRLPSARLVRRVLNRGVSSSSLLLLFSVGCSIGADQRVGYPAAATGRPVKVSYYGAEFAGKKTASGEPFKPEDLTAAHRKLPFNTRVQLRNPENGKSVEVRINDRGPFVHGRTYDVSQAAAQRLGIIDSGVAILEEVISR